jgi:protein-S-isoprenylcysteine O-methyltransferase Ste14
MPRHDMTDAPAFRMWPPFALGLPLFAGIVVTATAGDPVSLPAAPARLVGWMLVLVFAGWNGWTLWIMYVNRTAVLPGGATRTVLDRGPFRLSRNPLYLGLIVVDLAIALLWPSVWALLLAVLGIALLRWGAIIPEERYLAAKFGAEYDAYCRKVRRWL